MKIRLAISVDVTKISKERLYVGKKKREDGSVGKYCDMTILVDTEETDQFGNHGFIAENVSKEERESDVQGTILGNGKIIWRDVDVSPNPQTQPQPQAQPELDDDDIPF